MSSIPFIAGIVLVILKMLGYINWSWWIVTVPFWIGIIAFLLVIGFVGGSMALLQKWIDHE